MVLEVLPEVVSLERINLTINDQGLNLKHKITLRAFQLFILNRYNLGFSLFFTIFIIPHLPFEFLIILNNNLFIFLLISLLSCRFSSHLCLFLYLFDLIVPTIILFLYLAFLHLHSSWVLLLLLCEVLVVVFYCLH